MTQSAVPPRVSIRPIAPDDAAQVAHIEVSPEQEKFSGTIAEAFAMGEPAVDFHAIYAGDIAIGFFKIDRAYSDTYAYAYPGEPGLRAFMIDLRQQGRGYASAAVAALPDYLPRHYPEAKSVVLTVNSVNGGAIRAYRKGGFRDTGEIYEGGQAGPQCVMRMVLPDD